MRWILVLLTMLFFNSASAKDAGTDSTDHAEKLHNAKCTACHTTEVYTRNNRRINSLAALKNQVKRCEVPANTNWKPEETDAVIDFLNKKYYKF